HRARSRWCGATEESVRVRQSACHRTVLDFVQIPMQKALPQPATVPPTPVVVIPGPQGPQTITLTAPRTARELEAVKSRRDELSSQLKAVDTRRSRLLTELRQTNDPTATKGLEDRLALLDSRQLQLESDIQQTGQQLSSTAAGLIASTSDAPVFGGLRSKQ